MKLNTSVLIGPRLDWLVARASGHQLHKDALLGGVLMKGWWISGMRPALNNWTKLSDFKPSTDWSQGGPIIERELIEISPAAGAWRAVPNRTKYPNCDAPWFFGGTPLIAAMRCFVVSRMGDEVDVPEELL